MRAVLAALLLTLTAAPGCRFERRPDLPTDRELSLGTPASLEPAGTPAEDSARAVVISLAEALEVGDVARVARLTVPESVLIDQEEAVRWSHANPDSPLPRSLSAGEDAPDWRLETSAYLPLGEGAVLIYEYQALTQEEAPAARAVETFVLVRTELGWRLRHMHRSRGPDTGAAPL